nr:hypothetical protein NCPCFENI_01316 [Cupriavidus sp.]
MVTDRQYCSEYLWPIVFQPEELVCIAAAYLGKFLGERTAPVGHRDGARLIVCGKHPRNRCTPLAEVGEQLKFPREKIGIFKGFNEIGTCLGYPLRPRCLFHDHGYSRRIHIRQTEMSSSLCRDSASWPRHWAQ